MSSWLITRIEKVARYNSARSIYRHGKNRPAKLFNEEALALLTMGDPFFTNLSRMLSKNRSKKYSWW